MEAAMDSASSTVSAVMMIIVLAFVVGRIGVGLYARKKGWSARLVELTSSIATLILILCGVFFYYRG